MKNISQGAYFRNFTVILCHKSRLREFRYYYCSFQFVLISFYKTLYLSCVNSLRNWRYCLSSRSKFWRQSRDPKKGVRTSGLRLSWRPSRQISLSNYAISPATQAIVLMLSHYVFLFLFFFFFSANLAGQKFRLYQTELLAT